jgi:phosphopantetheinyl transferase
MAHAFAVEDRPWTKVNPLHQPLIFSASAGNALPAELLVSEQEQARALRFANHHERTLYLLQHHLLRSYLSHWLGIRAAELRFCVNANGKPSLEHSPLHFSISRSGKHLAFYFGPVDGGIDVEHLRSSQAFQDVIASHFHPHEQAAAHTDEGFFRVWTRKEALLKAVGSGLTDRLSAFDSTPDQVDYGGQIHTLSTYVTPCQVISLALSGHQTTAPISFSL